MTTTAPPASHSPVGRVSGPDRAGLAGTLWSELTKLRSVRSTYWSLLALVCVTIGFGAIASFGSAQHASQLSGRGRAAFLSTFDPTQQSLAGLLIGQLIIAVLGTLTITSEYSTGMIRTSLTVMPRRGTLFAAKGAVFTAVALATGVAASFASFLLGQAVMSGQHINAALGQPGVIRAVVGGGLFLAACGLLAYGLGAVLRHTAGAITATIALLFVTFLLVNLLPSGWQDHIDKWMPFNAGSQVWTVNAHAAQRPMLAPWTGYAVLCGYAAAAVLAGLILLRTRDA